jgi:pyruvate,water dikinase
MMFTASRTSEEAGADAGPAPGAALSGLGASPGKHVGRARLVLAPADFTKIREGDVLVARLTNPAYNVLLPLIGAVVTERGGLLSHPAIVSREYGVPGVVSCGGATARIPDGAMVEVCGDTGRVTVLS